MFLEAYKVLLRVHLRCVPALNSMTCWVLTGIMTGFCLLPAHPLVPVYSYTHGGKKSRRRRRRRRRNKYNGQGLIAGVPQRRHHAGPLTAVCLHAPPSIMRLVKH